MVMVEATVGLGFWCSYLASVSALHFGRSAVAASCVFSDVLQLVLCIVTICMSVTVGEVGGSEEADSAR